jgi:hypothetical protein
VHARYPLTGPAGVSPPSPTGRIQPYDPIPNLQYRHYGRLGHLSRRITRLTPNRAGTGHLPDYAIRDRLDTFDYSSVQTSVLLFSTFGNRKSRTPNLQDRGPLKRVLEYKVWKPWKSESQYQQRPSNQQHHQHQLSPLQVTLVTRNSQQRRHTHTISLVRVEYKHNCLFSINI